MHNINHSILYVIIGAIVSGVTGEAVKDGTFTGNQIIDLCIKIFVPIITGVSVAIIQKKIDKKK